MEIDAENVDSVFQDFSRRRIILPQVPKDLKDQQIDEDIFWHNNEAKALEKKLGSANGLFIRHEMCMFIPSPSFHKMFLFKELTIGKKGHSAITKNTLRNIGEVALRHLRKIDSKFEELSNVDESDEPVEVVFVVYVIKKAKKSNENSGEEDKFLRECQGNFEEQFEAEKLKTIKPSCLCIYENSVNESLVGDQQKLSDCRNKLKILAEKCLQWELFGMEPSNEEFRLPGDGGLKFSDTEIVKQKFSELFDSGRMYFLPDIDHVSDNLLYYINEKGSVENSDERHFSYSGELQLFCHDFLSRMEQKVPGIFLKDFQPQHIGNLFDWPYLRNYQIDWLFLGTDRIVVFEIGMLKDPENVKDAVSKKLTQVRDNLMPFLKVLLRAVYMSYNTGEEIDADSRDWDNFWDFFKNKVSFVILFPNASIDAVKSYLKYRSSSKGRQSSDQEILVACLKDEHKNQNKVSVIGLDVHDQILLDKSVKVEEMLTKAVHEMVDSQPNEDRGPGDFEKRLSFIKKLLALSFLTVVDDPYRPLSVDERYGPDYQKVSHESQTVFPSATVNGRNLILTREQHRILQEDKKFLIIHGEAGSGKTALLLMKALQLASDPSINNVLYIIPEQKEELNRYLEAFLLENEKLLNGKLQIWKFKMSYPELTASECPREVTEQVNSRISGNTGVALLIDEFYYDAALPLLFYPASYCWVSYVTHASKLTDAELFVRRKLTSEDESFRLQLVQLFENYNNAVDNIEKYSEFCKALVDLLLFHVLTMNVIGERSDSDIDSSFAEKILKRLTSSGDWNRSFQSVAEDILSSRQNRLDFFIEITVTSCIEEIADSVHNQHPWKQLEETIRGKFTDEYLHVLLRSSYPISKFGHDFVHKTKLVDAATASTVGAFVSSQARIVEFYHDCFKATPSELFEKHLPELSEKFKSSRLIAVITSQKRVDEWNSFKSTFSGEGSFFVMNFDGSYEKLNDLPITGAEYASVMLIVDIALGETENKEKTLQQVFYAVVTRACYEIVIVIDESQVELGRITSEASRPLHLYHCLVKGDALPALPDYRSMLEVYEILEKTKGTQTVMVKESIERSSFEANIALSSTLFCINLQKMMEIDALGEDVANINFSDPVLDCFGGATQVEPFKTMWSSLKELLRDTLEMAWSSSASGEEDALVGEEDALVAPLAPVVSTFVEKFSSAFPEAGSQKTIIHLLSNRPALTSMIQKISSRAPLHSSILDFDKGRDSFLSHMFSCVPDDFFDILFTQTVQSADDAKIFAVDLSVTKSRPSAFISMLMRGLLSYCDRTNIEWSSIGEYLDCVLELSLETKQWESIVWSVEVLSKADRLNNAVLKLTDSSFINISENEKSIAIVRLLIEKGVSWKQLLRNDSFIRVAVSKGNFVLATYLLEHDDRIDPYVQNRDKFCFIQLSEDLNREAKLHFEACLKDVSEILLAEQPTNHLRQRRESCPDAKTLWGLVNRKVQGFDFTPGDSD